MAAWQRQGGLIGDPSVAGEEEPVRCTGQKSDSRGEFYKYQIVYVTPSRLNTVGPILALYVNFK